MAHSKSFCLDGLKLAFRGRGKGKVILDTKRSYLRPICRSADNGTYKDDLNPLPPYLSFDLSNFLSFQTNLFIFF